MDNGPAYTSTKFQEFCKLWNITNNTGIPYNPQGQAIVEQHQTIKTNFLK
jgi:transposase InsO family protein